MKTSILQSMLARNKGIIFGLHEQQEDLMRDIRTNRSNTKKLLISMEQLEYLNDSYYRKKSSFEKNSKSLKQLAEIQKEIKEEIKHNDAMEAYLLMLALRD